VEFRRSLASSFLFRFFVHVASQLEADLPGYKPIFPDTYKSAAVPFHRPPVQGLQYYSKVPGEAVVGQPTRHMAADLQVTRLFCFSPCDDSLVASLFDTRCCALSMTPTKAPTLLIQVTGDAFGGQSAHKPHGCRPASEFHCAHHDLPCRIL